VLNPFRDYLVGQGHAFRWYLSDHSAPHERAISHRSREIHEYHRNLSSRTFMSNRYRQTIVRISNRFGPVIGVVTSRSGSSWSRPRPATGPFRQPPRDRRGCGGGGRDCVGRRPTGPEKVTTSTKEPVSMRPALTSAPQAKPRTRIRSFRADGGLRTSYLPVLPGGRVGPGRERDRDDAVRGLRGGGTGVELLTSRPPVPHLEPVFRPSLLTLDPLW
jgi:hypothetical protein